MSETKTLDIEVIQQKIEQESEFVEKLVAEVGRVIVHWVVRLPTVDSVRDTPRFKAIMDSLGLKEEGYFDKAGLAI